MAQAAVRMAAHVLTELRVYSAHVPKVSQGQGVKPVRMFYVALSRNPISFQSTWFTKLLIHRRCNICKLLGTKALSILMRQRQLLYCQRHIVYYFDFKIGHLTFILAIIYFYTNIQQPLLKLYKISSFDCYVLRFN